MVPPNEREGDVDESEIRSRVLHPQFEADVTYWRRADPKLAKRLRRIVEAVLQDPFNGMAKPEPLRGNLAGLWSRRLTREHRVIYRVTEKKVEFISARSYYDL